jgi:probable phosphoglycerate mutase
VTEAPPALRTRGTLDAAFLTNDEGATELILVRHGEQEIDPVRATAGDLADPPLSERGQVQARLVGERFQHQHIDVVYASPLRRARDTGAQIARHHGLETIIDGELREVEVFRDIPQDQTPLEFFGRQRLLGIRNRMLATQRWDVYPESESSFEFQRRVCNALEGILAVHGGQRVVVACHGGVINTYLGWVLGIGKDMWFRPAHTAVNVLRARDHVRAVETINDVHHLRTSEGDVLSW